MKVLRDARTVQDAFDELAQSLGVKGDMLSMEHRLHGDAMREADQCDKSCGVKGELQEVREVRRNLQQAQRSPHQAQRSDLPLGWPAPCGRCPAPSKREDALGILRPGPEAHGGHATQRARSSFLRSCGPYLVCASCTRSVYGTHLEHKAQERQSVRASPRAILRYTWLCMRRSPPSSRRAASK